MTETAPYMPIGVWSSKLDENLRKLRQGGVTTIVIAIPMKMLEPHERQAQSNHSQSLKRLAERGGLSACEANAILEDRQWHRQGLVESYNALLAHLREFSAEAERDASKARETESVSSLTQTLCEIAGELQCGNDNEEILSKIAALTYEAKDAKVLRSELFHLTAERDAARVAGKDEGIEEAAKILDAAAAVERTKADEAMKDCALSPAFAAESARAPFQAAARALSTAAAAVRALKRG